MLSPRKESLPDPCPCIKDDYLYLEPQENLSKEEYKAFASETLANMGESFVVDIDARDWYSVNWFVNTDKDNKIYSPRDRGMVRKKIIMIRLKTKV